MLTSLLWRAIVQAEILRGWVKFPTGSDAADADESATRRLHLRGVSCG
jgi:hypothetical protein